MRIKMNLPKLLLLLLSINSFEQHLQAQQTTVDSSVYDRLADLEKQVAYKKPGEDHFMVVGLATFGFVTNKTTVTSNGTSQISKTNSLADADHYEFSPMLLWRHGEKFLLEFEPSFDGNSLGVNWADISYFAAPGLIIRAGYLVIPFGTYNKRLAAGWIDKLPTDPAGVADLPPGSDFGVEVEGGLPLGNMKWNYDISVTNGMQLLPDGEIQGAGIVDNNENKTVTARLGLLPFSNSSLEIGVSGLYGTVGDDNSSFQGRKSGMFALDANYVKLFNPILLNIKGQYNYIHIDKQNYLNPNDSTSYSFDNNNSSGFAQISIRPAGSHNKLVKNLEAAFRLGNFTTPKNSLWGQKSNLVEAALLYWLNWRTALKFGYLSSKTTSTTLGDQGTYTKSASFFLQFSIEL
ncbi:MAG: hypothetical protein Q8918_13915 [Bacteroidota bacterium]|nr:hypothetical protein [Bacteroidota bacterium]MDP4251198.1 hypothetical protein [Bacteroidota bacterium]